MDPAVSLPVQLDVRGRRCVVVGGGVVGTRRVAALLDAGAQVVVISPDPAPALRTMAAEGSVELVERPFAPEDLDGARLVVAATGVLDVDEAVSTAAGARGVLVNRSDRADRGDLAFPAVVRRGPVRLAVSTGGAAPAVTRLVAESVDEGLDAVLGLDGDGLALLVDVVAEVRRELIEGAYGGPRPGGGADHEVGVTPGPLDWRSALDASILDLIRQGRRAEAKERLLACLSSS